MDTDLRVRVHRNGLLTTFTVSLWCLLEPIMGLLDLPNETLTLVCTLAGLDGAVALTRTSSRFYHLLREDDLFWTGCLLDQGFAEPFTQRAANHWLAWPSVWALAVRLCEHRAKCDVCKKELAAMLKAAPEWTAPKVLITAAQVKDKAIKLVANPLLGSLHFADDLDGDIATSSLDVNLGSYRPGNGRPAAEPLSHHLPLALSLPTYPPTQQLGIAVTDMMDYDEENDCPALAGYVVLGAEPGEEAKALTVVDILEVYTALLDQDVIEGMMLDGLNVCEAGSINCAPVLLPNFHDDGIVNFHNF